MPGQKGLQRFNSFATNPGQGRFSLKTGRVVAYHWQNHTIDVQVSDGSMLAMVHILEPKAGFDYGELHVPMFPEGVANMIDSYGPFPFGPRETFAVVAFVEGYEILPVCLGFYYPDESALMFGNLQYLARYVGDTFRAVDINGTHWVAFDATGTGISINSGDYAGVPDLYQTDWDGKSKPSGEVRSLTLYLASGSMVHLDGSNSNITIHSEAEIAMDGAGAVSISGNPLTLDGLVGIYF